MKLLLACVMFPMLAAHASAQVLPLTIPEGTRIVYSITLTNATSWTTFEGTGMDSVAPPKEPFKLSALFKFTANDIRGDVVIWAAAISSYTKTRIATRGSYLPTGRVGRIEDFTSYSNGTVPFVAHQIGDTELLSTIEHLALSSPGFLQIFFLRDSLAGRAPGGTWNEDVSETSSHDPMEHHDDYSIRWSYDAVVDTLGAHCARLRFDADVSSVSKHLNKSISYQHSTPSPFGGPARADGPLVTGHISLNALSRGRFAGTAYYCLDDGMLVAWNSTHTTSFHDGYEAEATSGPGVGIVTSTMAGTVSGGIAIVRVVKEPPGK